MSSGMIGFFFGVVVGAFGAIFLLGLYLLLKERGSHEEEIPEVEKGIPVCSLDREERVKREDFSVRTDGVQREWSLSHEEQIHPDLKV